jgi:hypothetical protein
MSDPLKEKNSAPQNWTGAVGADDSGQFAVRKDFLHGMYEFFAID